jgi:hypothetical protein
VARARARARAGDALELVELGARISPRSSAPTASQTSWIVTSRPRQRPARIGPL